MDNFLFASVYSFANRGVWSDALIILFAAYWELAAVAGLILYLWSPRLRRVDLKARAVRVALAVFSAAVARFGLVSLIRYFYPRERPFVFEGFNSLISQNPLESSFPSGHAAFFMALAVYFLLAGERKMGLFLLASAVAIGIARVAAGVHWPSDIVVGWLLGGLVGLIVFRMSPKAAR